MDTFTVRLPRWPVEELFGPNPLIRTSDRIEALVLVLVVAVSLLTVRVAARVGTAVHDPRRHVYGEQARTRHTVTATVTDDNGAQRFLRTNTIAVQARWSAAGADNTGAVTAPWTTKSGEPIEIWVDDAGSQVDTPTPTSRAAVDAVTAALAIWLSVTAVAAMLFTGFRAVCDRIRVIGWQHDIDTLVGPGEHTTGQP